MSEPDRPRPSLEQLNRYAEEFTASRTLQTFGARVSFPTRDLVRVEVDEARPEFLGGLGSAENINGGMISAMFDLIVGCTGALVDPTRRAATMQLSMTFERPVMGRRVRAEATVTNAGTRAVFSEARIYDGEGNLCARCNGVLRLSTQPWDRSSPAVN